MPGEGIYDWLRHREPRWATLAIVHRLDKETSGVLVFAKTTLANRSLTEQFTKHEVRKRYVLLTDRPVPAGEIRVETAIARAGERYVSRPPGAGGEPACTTFTPVPAAWRQVRHTVLAEPLTGRTHQIRVHAAASGFPVLGDVLYGGTPAPRLCLHAAGITFAASGVGRAGRPSRRRWISTPTRARRCAPRSSIPAQTNAYRLIHGAADGWPGWRVDRLGDYLLSQSEDELTRRAERSASMSLGARGIYHKRLSRQVRRLDPAEASPRHVGGERRAGALHRPRERRAVRARLRRGLLRRPVPRSARQPPPLPRRTTSPRTSRLFTGSGTAARPRRC